MVRAPAALLLALCACAPARGPTAGFAPDSAAPSTGMMTLCVANESAAAGTIRVWVGEFRALTVASGKRECKPIRPVSTGTRLYAESMAGGLKGPVRYQAAISRVSVSCWEWVLRDNSNSENRLVPCGFSEP